MLLELKTAIIAVNKRNMAMIIAQLLA